MRYSLIAHPWSRRTKIEEWKDLNDMLVYHVYTIAKPVDGEANKTIVELMAEYLWYKKYQIKLVSWHKSKHKVIEIVT